MFSGYRTIDNNVVSQINLMQRELESAFSQASINSSRHFNSRSLYPPVNITTTSLSFEVALHVSNLKADSIEITVDDNVLLVKADRENSAPEGVNFLLRERMAGQVSHRISLTKDCDPENITADYKLGVLTIKIAKREKAQPIKVQIH